MDVQQPSQLDVRVGASNLCSQTSPQLAYESSRLSCLSTTSSKMPKNLRHLEQILVAAQQQQMRQLRRIQLLKKQVELTAAQQAALEAKERAKEERLAKRQAELAEEAARRAAQAELAEERRKAVAQTAERHQEAVRSKLEGKLARMKPRYDLEALEQERRLSALKSAERMQRTLERKERVLEERRAAVMAAEEASRRRMQQKQELRLLQVAIRREEDFLAEERRREVQACAEADEAAKVAYYQAKQEAREQRLQQRQAEAELLRSLRAEEASARFDYIRTRAAEVSAQDHARREALNKKLETKLQRVDALSEERSAITSHMRSTLLSNELKFKQAMERAKANDRLGVLPTELLQMMEQLEESASSLHLAVTPSLQDCGGPSTARVGTMSRATSARASPRPAAAAAAPATIPASRAPRVSTSGSSAVPAAAVQRQQEALLQRVLEEEILREMERETTLQAATEPAERRALLKQFAAEREVAKARILQIGNQMLPASGTAA